MEDRPARRRIRRIQFWPRNYKGFFLRMLLYMIIITAVIYLLQGKLVYLPHRYSIEDLREAADQWSLSLWPTPDGGYRGLVTLGGTGTRGTVVVFHGNAGSALNRLHYVSALERLGFTVVLAEYPGYGSRQGRLSERALVADAKATARLAARDFGGPLYVWGESLGCGVASAVAADSGLPVDGLALITPFASLPEVAQALYWFVPVKWLVRDKYDSIKNLRRFEKPVAILVAGKDELIPGEHGQAIYDSLTTRKKMWVFEDSGHNTWPASPEEKWWQEVADFVSSDVER
jgi:alpha-beta hydrolase superfamily lysophospholipase